MDGSGAVAVCIVSSEVAVDELRANSRPRALSTKANMISGLTGIPHEKIQVFHHWTSYAMFVLALIHTFPYIIYHIWKGDMMHQWKTSIVYWTGTAALLSQTYLTLMSLPFIR